MNVGFRGARQTRELKVFVIAVAEVEHVLELYTNGNKSVLMII
jgi:hypothetical protein